MATVTGDELRAAAERRCAGGSVGFTNASWIPGSVEGLLRDAEALADAYLAEHPADDGVPVTQDWLVSIGFEPNPSSLTFDHRPLSLELFAENVGDPPSVEAVFDGIVPHVNTRGGIRRLLRALGVEPKE